MTINLMSSSETRGEGTSPRDTTRQVFETLSVSRRSDCRRLLLELAAGRSINQDHEMSTAWIIDLESSASDPELADIYLSLIVIRAERRTSLRAGMRLAA